MAIEYNFTLDMDRSKRDNNIAYARTGDVDSITINADLVLNGAAYTPTGTNAFFECITPNGHSVRAAAEKTGSSVSVEVPSAAFQAAGVINVAYFRFESGEADNPTYVESTEPFAIIVREGIGDDIDAGDYIEEWRQLADQLEAIVAEVEQKAEQVETAINEQKTEVDTLKSQAQQQIAQDVVDVESAATTAKSSISTQVDSVETAAETAKSEINDKVAGIQSQIDTVVSDAKQEVDENIAELDKATQDAVDAMNEALSGEQVKQLKDAISRHWALDAQDMGAISSGNDLDTFTTVKSYVCKTDAIAKSLVDKPEDLACSFIMHVMSIDSSSNYLMQLIIPQTYDDTKSSVSFYIRKRVSAGTFTGWKKVGADVIAGIGIKIEDDVVSVDPDSFHQSYEDVSLASSDTSITGGASIEELAVKGHTRQNLWVNPSGTDNGVTVTNNDDGTMTIEGTSNSSYNSYIMVESYALAPNKAYTVNIDTVMTGFGFNAQERSGASGIVDHWFGGTNNQAPSVTFVTMSIMTSMMFVVRVNNGQTVSGTYRVMLREATDEEVAAAQQTASTLQEGGTADMPQDHPVTLQADHGIYAADDDFDWCPPGINGVEELSIVTAGKNLLSDLITGEISSNGIDYSYSNGVVTLNGTSSGQSFSGVFAKAVLQPGDYIASVSGSRDVELQVGNDETAEFIAVNGRSFRVDKTITVRLYLKVESGKTFSNVNAYAQLERGSTATAYEPPAITQTAIDMQGHTLHSLPDGTRDILQVDGTGKVTLVQHVGIFDADADTVWTRYNETTTFESTIPSKHNTRGRVNRALCDSYPIVESNWGGTTPYRSVAFSVYTGYESKVFYGNVDQADSVHPTMRVLYKLAEPQTVELGSVELPSVKSDKMNVWIISDKVSEEVKFDISLNKVDYREIDAPSADDVYSKSEVDSLLEAKEDAFEVLPVSSGGTGVTTAAAERNRLGLGNTTGALPIANGGTGATEPGVTMLSNLGITFGTADPPSIGTPGSIYIQYFE